MTSVEYYNLTEKLEASLISAEEKRVAAQMEDASEILQNSAALLLADKSYAELVEQILEADAAPLREQSMPECQELLRFHARICSLRAVIYSDQDRLNEAESQIEQSLALSRFTDVTDGKALFVLADIHRKQGKYEQSINELTICASALKQQGDERTAAFVFDNLAHAVAARGDLPQALTHRKEAIEIIEKLGEVVPAAIFKGNLAKDYYRLGDLNKAEKTIQIALKGLKNRDPRCESYSYRVLGDILIAQNKIPEARAAYFDGAKSEVTHCRAMASVGLGWLEFQYGAPEDALMAFGVAHDSLLPQDDEALKTEALSGVALVQWKLGNHEDAMQKISAALSHDMTRDNLYVRGFVFAAYAVLSRAEGDNETASTASLCSDDAFKMSARPLVGLSQLLSERLKT